MCCSSTAAWCTVATEHDRRPFPALPDLHYVPEGRTEVSPVFVPLVDPATGVDVAINEATGGGPCGENWEGGAH